MIEVAWNGKGFWAVSFMATHLVIELQTEVSSFYFLSVSYFAFYLCAILSLADLRKFTWRETILSIRNSLQKKLPAICFNSADI